MSEKVFCLSRRDLEQLMGAPLPEGGFAVPPLERVLALPQHYLDRPAAEQDPAFKQIIPYQLFFCRDRFFTYERGKKVGEQRLSGRRSLGIGGHLNSDDAVAGRMGPAEYRQGLAREREEELLCASVPDETFLGWINDDSDPVGQVHLGAVHLCRVDRPEAISIRPGSEDIHGLGWFTADEIISRAGMYEPWSMLALDLACR